MREICEKSLFDCELLTLVAMKVLSLFCAAFRAFLAFAASTVDDGGTDRLRDASAREATSDDNELLDFRGEINGAGRRFVVHLGLQPSSGG